jgi:hypothetical protein
MHGAEQRREGVATLNAGGCELTFYRRAERIDGEMPFASLDFLAGVEAAWPTGFGRRTALAARTERSIYMRSSAALPEIDHEISHFLRVHVRDDFGAEGLLALGVVVESALQRRDSPAASAAPRRGP